MGSLSEVVKDPARRRAVIDDCVLLIEAEVAAKTGLTGIAVKTGFKTVKSFRPGIIGMAMDGLLDDFAKQVDPFWADCQKKGEDPRQFFTRKQVEVANALLSVTDERGRRSPHTVLVKAYQALRPKAVEHIGAAMPRFSELLVKYVG